MDGVEQALVDGVPVLWVHAPPPFAAGLVFAVGRRDETFARGGLTHLVEHLAMSALGRTSLECNASVDLDTTEFTATGSPARVVTFLRRICEVLADLPLDRLSVEADVLRTEDGRVAHPVLGALLAERYGAGGVGLAGFREPAVRSLGAELVRQWLDLHFHRRNAVLWLSGPPPEGLSLSLPDGSHRVRPPQPVRPLVTPVLVEHPFDGAVALGGELPDKPPVRTACRILRDRVEDDLRHRRGLSYTVGTEHVAVEPDRRFVVVTADCREGQEAVVARALWAGLGRLIDEGPSQAELAHDRDVLAEYLDDPRSLLDEVVAAASGLVNGMPERTRQQLREDVNTVTAAQVREAAAALRDAALVGVPQGTDPALPGLGSVPEWSETTVVGRTFPRSGWRSGAPRGAVLVVGDDSAGVRHGAGEQITVQYEDAVGAAPGRRGRVVTGRGRRQIAPADAKRLAKRERGAGTAARARPGRAAGRVGRGRRHPCRAAPAAARTATTRPTATRRGTTGSPGGNASGARRTAR